MEQSIINGNNFYVNENYESAITQYTKAIEYNSKNSEAYLNRSGAYIILEKYLEAAEDASKALEIDENLFLAYMRKGIACFHMEEFETAIIYFQKGIKLDFKQNIFEMWIRKCQEEIKDIDSDYDKEYINQSEYGEKNSMTLENRNYRYEWYQTKTDVVVDIFAKNLTHDKVHLELGIDYMKIKISEDNDKKPYQLYIKLKYEINTKDSKYNILGSKIEIIMKKLKPVLDWPSLENKNNNKEHVPTIYPTSRKKNIDWNKLETNVKKEDEDEKLDGDAAVHKLFKQIYASADEDTRKAMNKSFQESGGTCLSTNWKEVGSKKVECTPPSGFEAKKYSK